MLVFFDILRESRKSFLRDWHCLAWSASTPAPCHKMHFNCKILDSTMYIWYIFYLSLHPGTSETKVHSLHVHLSQEPLKFRMKDKSLFAQCLQLRGPVIVFLSCSLAIVMSLVLTGYSWCQQDSSGKKDIGLDFLRPTLFRFLQCFNSLLVHWPEVGERKD